MTRAGQRWRHRGAHFVLFLFLIFATALVSAEKQLTLDSVVLKLGEPDSAVVQELRKQHKVERFDRVWSVQPLDRNPTAPAVGIRTANGRIDGVTFIWGPGFTPSAEEVGEQLAHALPSGAKCEIRNVGRPQEGGIVRTLEWLCGSYRVSFVTGVYPLGGNTASISIDRVTNAAQ